MLQDFLPWLTIAIGFVGLIWSADRFVEGSATVATHLGVSKLVIGLTVVAFGTSAPEIIVSISSSLKDSGELAVGNAIGSNLANVGMVLGITALIVPLPIKAHILKEEAVIMFAVMLIAGWMLWDAQLQFWEGLVLVSLMAPILIWIKHSKKEHPEELEDIPTVNLRLGVIWFLLGLVLLIASAEILVWGAKEAAFALGVSPLIVGLTIVAIGTSLPELAASIASALKKHHDIAIGNVIGSNIFNILLVMGIPSIIQPLNLEAEVFSRDYAGMLIISAVLISMMLFSYLKSNNKQSQLGRLAGAVLLLLYVTYYIVLF